MGNDIQYRKKGPRGRTCADCKHYEAESENRKTGKCMGQDVEEEATCNFFEPKNKGEKIWNR